MVEKAPTLASPVSEKPEPIRSPLARRSSQRRRHEEEISDAAKGIDPLVVRPGLDRFFQFAQQRMLRVHSGGSSDVG